MKIGIGIIVGLSLTAAAQQLCKPEIPPRHLLDLPRNEYRGEYKNKAWGYSVVIPGSLTGYDQQSGPHHGFGVVLGQDNQDYIEVNGEANSLELKQPREQAEQALQYMREKSNLIDSFKIVPASLGKLSAAQLVVRYSCHRSDEKRVRVSVFALGPGRSPAYEISLYSAAERYDLSLPLFDQMVKSWKFTGYLQPHEWDGLPFHRLCTEPRCQSSVAISHPPGRQLFQPCSQGAVSLPFPGSITIRRTPQSQ